MSQLLGHFQHLLRVRRSGDQGDGQLLERFLELREQEAFAALVGRHGPMVLGVCRRVLGNQDDAEDAFQVTFLTLASKPGGLRHQRALGGWLYKVAYHVALRAKARAGRRRALEQRGTAMSPPDPAAEITWHELGPVLDEELQRLPE